jgi:ribosomal protein S19E (S16A)
LCSELDQWYKYVKDNEGDKRAPINQPWYWQRF